MWWRRRKVGEEPTPSGSDPTPAAVPPTTHRTAFILIGLGGATLTAFGIAAIGSVFAAVFLALVLTICVHPIRRVLEKRGVPSLLASVAVLASVLILLGAFVFALVISLGQFATLLPTYAPQFQQWANDVADWLGSLGIGQAQVSSILSLFNPASVFSAVGALLGGAIGGAAGFISAAVVLLTMLILMAMDSSLVPAIVRGMRPSRPQVADALQRFAVGVRRYMIATTALGIAQGVINWIALLILGIPGAALWGILSFLCSFIPNIGYFVALIPPLVFGALVGGWPTVIGVIVVYGVINAVIQSVIQPKVVGDAVSLNQTLTFLSVLIWAVILGPMGAILAIPLTLLTRMLLVDSNPGVSWIKPALGEVTETRARLATERADAARERRAKRERARSGSGRRQRADVAVAETTPDEAA